MKAKFIVSVLYYFSGVVFVSSTIVIIVFLGTSIVGMCYKSNSGFDIESMDVPFYISLYNPVGTNVDYSYSSDRTIRYSPVIKEYKVQVKPNTSLAYYFFIFKLIILTIWITGSWFSLKILNAIKKCNPFNFQSVKYLKIIAVMFISSDILKFINNLVFNQFIPSYYQHGFQFPHQYSIISDGILLGLVIWILAVIFQRGEELQTENDLTV